MVITRTPSRHGNADKGTGAEQPLPVGLLVSPSTVPLLHPPSPRLQLPHVAFPRPLCFLTGQPAPPWDPRASHGWSPMGPPQPQEHLLTGEPTTHSSSSDSALKAPNYINHSERQCGAKHMSALTKGAFFLAKLECQVVMDEQKNHGKIVGT